MAGARPLAVAGLAAVVSLGMLAGDCGRVDREMPRPVASDAPEDVALTAATTRYHDYVVAEVAALQTTTKAFTDAVRAGDMTQAEARYAPARMHFEAIEPVVETFGEFGDDIDASLVDVGDPARWTGFHRIEKALWADGSLVGMTPFANQLDLDIFALKARAARSTFASADLANRAGDLLSEISTTTITGEKDRYSHTDLWDIAAGIAGARQAFDLLEPALTARDPGLARRIEARFADVSAWLDRHRQGAGYVDWSTVPQPQLRALSVAVDALAEPLSQVAATLG